MLRVLNYRGKIKRSKKMKKVAALILTFIMLVSAVSGGIITAWALTSGDFEYTVSENKATITAYNGSAEVLSIPSTLGGYSVAEIGEGAFQNNITLQRVTVPAGVNKIGARAFYSCVMLRSISLPATVSELSEKTFANCSSLERVTAAGSLTKIYREAFNYCSSLQSLNLTSALTYIGDNAFANCYAIQINMEKLSGDITYIGSQAFRNCYKAYGSANISAQTTVGGLAFDACGAQAINFNSEHPKYSSENGIIFNKDKTSLVRYPAGRANTEYTIPSTVAQIDSYAFHRAQQLESIVIPESVSIIGDYAFASCLMLDNVVLPSSVDELSDYAFNSCPMLKSVSFPENLISIGAHAFGYCDLREINLPSSLESIGKYAFYRNYNLTEAVLPNSVTEMDSFVFEDCRALSSVTLSENLGAVAWGTFANCEALSSIVVPEGCTEIEGAAFMGCKALESVYLPSTLEYVGRNAFSDTKLVEVYYNDAQTKWEIIDINETGNRPLQSAEIHFGGWHFHSYSISGLNNDMLVFRCSCEKSYSERFSDYINVRGSLPVDLNADGIVNAKDYAILIKNY
ncbi:MAG: leucine-rich repeat domain-containing protein [Ruminococcaceae bacterium]|nr:leucine-rich repeat domain-containing protein [Oscillospiraceae bacterium]